ncbi:transcriptional regulator [Cetobacterium sp.]|uniref:transcriptional regulator n=1 Tax=Cetobacterium sp. TaxID=2071632 RepID=UPI003F2FDF17
MSNMIAVKEVAELCSVGNGKAYQIIREVNKEMKEKGYLIIRGRVNKLYLLERFGIIKGD